MNAIASPSSSPPQLRRVLIVTDETATWRVAGLPQIERLLLTLQEWAAAHGPIEVHLHARDSAATEAFLRQASTYSGLSVATGPDIASGGFDLVLSTRLFLHRDALAAVAEHFAEMETNAWNEHAYATHFSRPRAGTWQYLANRREIASCERRFLRGNGKTQDGMVSRYLNRRISRSVTRWLLKLPVSPNAWSISIFILPLLACVAFLQGTYLGFVVGCAVFQLYSILDGCDGEIARARFLHSDFGRRLDSFLDFLSNLLLALGVGFGLAVQLQGSEFLDWFYIGEGVAVAGLIVLSEGIVFTRRTRSPAAALAVTKWNGALYHRHHEMLERSGIFVFGERLAYWLVQLTKRDMAILFFFILALAAYPQFILHLFFIVAGANSILASNAFLRPSIPRLATEAS